MQAKSEAFCAFKSFKVHVENLLGKAIKILHTDCGGEYYSKEFQAFCDEKGIKRKLTVAYLPQQNGISERKNRIILNIVRSLLAKDNVSKNF